jgi:2-methylaconitate cis-trans-isomerase PrpF
VCSSDLLPTGNLRDVVAYEGGSIEVSIVDAANPLMFLRAEDLGLEGGELPDDVNARADVLDHVERIRGACAVMLGLCERAEDAATASPVIPFPSIVSAPARTMTAKGIELGADDMDIRARAFSMQRMHHAYPGTAMICTAAAASMPGTIANEVARLTGSEVRIAHPKGVAVGVTEVDLTGPSPEVVSVSITRTARRLMRGELFVRA